MFGFIWHIITFFFNLIPRLFHYCIFPTRLTLCSPGSTNLLKKYHWWPRLTRGLRHGWLPGCHSSREGHGRHPVQGLEGMGWIWSLALSPLLTVDEPHQHEWAACQKWRPSYPPRSTRSESAQRTPSTWKSVKSCSRLWSGKSHWTHRELCSSERWPCLFQSHLQWEGSENEKGLPQRHGHCCSLCPHSAMPANAHPSAAWPCNRFNSTSIIQHLLIS